jgi:hypothetical protein
MLVDTADRVGALEAVKRQLVKQPDPAAAKLVTVLEELSKIYGAIEDELTTYLSIFLDDSDPKQLARERAALARLDGGLVRARMQEARGRCSKIWNIYVRYLTPWFDRLLNPGEREQLRSLFRELSDVDSQMVDAIDEVASWLESEATETSALIEGNDFAAANARIVAARREVRPLRQRIAEAMMQIRSLEGDFVEMSGAV